MSVTRARATFRIATGSVTAASVSKRLGMLPDESHDAGESNPRNGMTWAAGLWCLQSTLPESEPLSAHLGQLLDRVEPVADVLAALHDEGLAMDWFCFIDRENGQGGPSFTPDLLARLGALPVVLDLDIY